MIARHTFFLEKELLIMNFFVTLTPNNIKLTDETTR